MDAPDVLKITNGKKMYGSNSTLNIGRGTGLEEDRMKLIKDVQAIPFPGIIEEPFETPAKTKNYEDGGCFSYLVTHPTGTMLIYASANYVPGKFRGVKVDTLYLATGVLGLQSEQSQDEYWHELVETTQPSLIIPVHWDNFGLPLNQTLSPLPGPFDNFTAAKNILDEKVREAYNIHFQEEMETIDLFDADAFCG
ncbi:hypothetical protein TI39_contig4430g00001 [Zymoseptoria brevis]|uniref:Metallo-beta-lactamase domain-containing protein n=1 Tax=Zymoseptoria brevis TaxID=1047168 RepID=A0A0F4G6Q7_9PEZI|nr:hypothetical protein TI39_contig4430g00001 [Zymoseptoria brevis]